MKPRRVQLTVVQKAAAKARVQKVTDTELLMLYMKATTEQREELFADTNRAAEIAGLSRRTIQFWIGIGLVRAVRVGKQYRVSLDSLREYFQELIDD